LREIQELRAKVEQLEASQKSRDGAGPGQAEDAHQSLSQSSAPRASMTPQKSFTGKNVDLVDEVHQTSRYAGDFSRPTTGETLGAAAIEELFYKLHMMQSKIDQHEVCSALGCAGPVQIIAPWAGGSLTLAEDADEDRAAVQRLHAATGGCFADA
jgi:hypothetical protein